MVRLTTRSRAPPEKGHFRVSPVVGCVREPGRASWRGLGKAFQGQCCRWRGPQGPQGPGSRRGGSRTRLAPQMPWTQGWQAWAGPPPFLPASPRGSLPQAPSCPGSFPPHGVPLHECTVGPHGPPWREEGSTSTVPIMSRPAPWRPRVLSAGVASSLSCPLMLPASPQPATSMVPFYR